MRSAPRLPGGAGHPSRLRIAGSEAAQRDALGGRVGRHAVVPAEQAEVGRAPERVVNGQVRAVAEGVAGDDLDRERHLREGLRRARGADRQRIQGLDLREGRRHGKKRCKLSDEAHRGQSPCFLARRQAASHAARVPNRQPGAVPLTCGSPISMAFVNPASAADRYDVLVVGSGAAGGHAAYTLAMGGAKVLMIEAGRNYDPVAETPMFQTNAAAPLRGSATPDKPFGFYAATVGGGWEVAGQTTGGATRFAPGPTIPSRAAATGSDSTGRYPTRTWRRTTTRSRC